MKAATLLCPVVFTLTTVHALHYPQYFQIFKHNPCLGDPLIDFLESATNLTQVPALDDAIARSSRGLVVPGDFDDSVLSLNEFENYKGENQVVNGTEARFGQPLTVGSLAFTGAKNFTLYKGDNFTGESVCIVPTSTAVSRGWGLTFNPTSHNITVQSVKLDCDPSATRIIIHESLEKSQKNFYIQGDSNNLHRSEKILDIKWLD